MTNPEQKEAYFRYLTERLDNSQSKNIVISTSVDLILQKAQEVDNVRVLDIGCFSGAMLNRIRNEVSEEVRKRIEFVGIDADQEALALGKAKYRGLTLISRNLDETFDGLGKFDIAIMSNVLHEAISDKADTDYQEIVTSMLAKTRDLTNEGGHLIILDGLRSENDLYRVKLSFATPQMKDTFLFFAKEYSAFPIETIDLGDGFIQTRIKDLAAFLTKARYLQEKYWPIESTQIYQFFTAGQFESALQSSGFEVEQMEPQVFTQEHLEDIFSFVDPKISFPVKNILIVARRT